MEEILLKDICDLDNGYAFKSDDYVEASDTLNCRMSNIRPDGTFDILYSAKYLPNEFAEKYEDYLLNDGDLIIAMTDMAGDPKILGVPTVVDTKGYKLLLNQRVGKLRFIKPGVNADYLKLALQSKRVREYLKRFAGGGVQLNVSKKDILNAPVRMRTEEEQDYIADLFRRILEIKKQREQELLCLDNLIKARFVEMFEDGESPIKTVEELCSEIVDCPHTTPKYEGELKNPAIRTSEIKKGYITWDSMRYVSDEEYEERVSRLRPEAGDIVYGREGTFGNAAVLPEGYKFCLGQRVMLLRPDYTKCTSEYLLHAVISDDVYRQAVGKNNASTVAHVNVKDVKQFKIPLPSFDKQNQFAEFVKQVDKSKVAVQKALDETKLLFDSLMQQYFG